MQTLGTTKEKFVFVSEGTLGPAAMILIILEVIKAAGMNPARTARLDTYPYRGGGGNGFTLFQPLMESYIVADVYYDLNETEILLSTCKPERMDENKVMEILEINLGKTRKLL